MLPSSVQYSMILCPKVRASSQLYFSFMYIFIGLGSFAATCFLVFVGWTVYEWRISHKTDKHSRALTPFNILLGICLISNVIHDGTYAMVWFISEVIYVTMIQHDFERHVRYLASEIFLATWAMAYLGYCWVRSETILKRVWTTKLRWVKRAFVVAPFFILSPSLFQAVKITIPQTFGMQTTFNTASYWLQAVSAAALLMMDILLFYTFQAYVSGLSEENSLFLLISRYGIGFSSCCFCYSVLSLTKPFLKSETVYIKIALSIVMHIVSFLMLVMKIHLFFVNKEELSPAQLGRRMSRQIEQSKARMDTESSSSTGKASVQMQLGRDRVGSLASVGSGKTEVTSSPAVRKYSTKRGLIAWVRMASDS
ncbi:hypothetical protein BCR33DRAFT_190051 [Rhizoclosmatium globosum]|uniref:Uncharacterized protein n=1 Tax=Rhizoclosmatium globosum TaxID=329046 RepID=A0A1Y2D1N1_9FUNG|nr:hypothetical protein BCR33DRAFT_190051 [Rhizoclosmatium globosum]|eukprot:ORY53188.1 hypothetical protein BCR33DRAFT_190051 [Rhizoclosmatium globosum]